MLFFLVVVTVIVSLFCVSVFLGEPTLVRWIALGAGSATFGIAYLAGRHLFGGGANVVMVCILLGDTLFMMRYRTPD